MSKVNQTLHAKHRIITKPTEGPNFQHSYRVSWKEQDAIHHHVQQMLKDDVIQT